MKWVIQAFNELSARELYQILKLRINIFMLEQQCLYPECDDKDLVSHHLMGYRKDEIVAYVRIIPPGISYEKEASIGRVGVARSYRKEGVGLQLMRNAILHTKTLYPNKEIKISAQNHLRDFYGQVGFIPCSQVYLEDDIPHVAMKL